MRARHMASRAVRLHPLAAEEAVAADAWYYSRNPKVAAAFRIELSAAIEGIAEAPERWPAVQGRFRRYLLRRFPFSVVYFKIGPAIEVVALAHHRRKPGYWTNR